MVTLKRSYFLTSSAGNFTVRIALRAKIYAAWISLAAQGAQTGPISAQLSLQDTSTMTADPSGIQYSDNVFALLVCRANLTGNAPMATAQFFPYREPVFSERGFYLHTVNAQADTFDIGVTLEYTLG